MLALALAVPVVLVSARASPTAAPPGVDLAWGCGGVRLSPRMQYTATSYAEPLSGCSTTRCDPSATCDVTHAGESRYLVERVQFQQQRRRHRRGRGLPAGHPLGGPAWGCSPAGSQNGSIHRYLGYSFVALLAVLVVVAL